MKIKAVYSYDRMADKTMPPYNYVQVVMIRGLFGKWKQPIYYDYDSNMSKSILLRIIESSGFYVTVVVSNLRATNRRLHNELNVTYNKPSFESPTNHPIFVFANALRLLKLIRNHFINYRSVNRGKEINKSTIEELLHLTSTSDMRLTYKINESNLTVQGAARQKVKLAAKLFSHMVVLAIHRCGTLGLLPEASDWMECGTFFKQVNDWFDCVNVRVPESDSRERVKAFGLALEVQRKIIQEMSDAISQIKVKGSKCLLPFQKGILMTNNALNLLFDDVRDRFVITYLLTYRLNQDVLENLFGLLRSKGVLHDHPDPIEFRYRLRSYILGKNEGPLSTGANVETDDTADILEPDCQASLLSSKHLSTITSKKCSEEKCCDDVPEKMDDLKCDALEHVAGFLCKRLNIAEETNNVNSCWRGD